MSIRHAAKARRGVAAVALAAGLLLAVAGCGGDGESGGKAESQSSDESAENKGTDKKKNPSEASDEGDVIAELKGADGVAMEIHSVRRDAGGFVTVNGAVKNDGQKDFYQTAEWRGNEKEILANGHSLGGAALVDEKGKKRYYVLRDTEGRCLCTTGITNVGAGETIPVFVQFPAPPEGTTEVEFSLPTFDSATVEITE